MNFCDMGDVKPGMLDTATAAPQSAWIPLVREDPTTKWFASNGCVIEDGDDRQVFVGGTLVGRFKVGDTGARNMLLVNLALDERQRLGRLASAFRISNSRTRWARGGGACVEVPGGEAEAQ